MAQKISRDNLAALLMKNLRGTALQPIAEKKSYVTGPDGFVAPETIDKIINMFQQTIGILKSLNPYRKSSAGQHIVKIEKAIESIHQFGTKAK